MIAYGVLLIWFWIYVRQWLDQLYGHTTNIARIILWLGVVGAIFFIVYIYFLGTTGEVNRFMRRYGILIYFVCTPLAQILLFRQHYNIFPSMQKGTVRSRVLQYQLIVIVLMLAIGIVSGALDVTHTKTYESENIVEWNLALLMQLYFLGIFFIWKEYKYYFKNNSDSTRGV
jgi:magnesium-transporting ATPase (P-type)